MDAPIEALERHMKLVDTVSFLDGRAPVNIDAMPERFSVLAPVLRELRLERFMLPNSTPVYWSRRMAEAARAIAPSFDLASITCHRDLVYCDQACCWFEDPVLSLTDNDGNVLPIQALTWWFVDFREEATGGIRRGLGITGWAHQVTDDFLTPAVWVRVPEGDSLAGAVNYEVEGYRNCAIDCAQFVVAAGVFMRQKIATVETHRPDRHARKRIEKAGWKGAAFIDVVRLRARESTARAIAARESLTEPQWRWMVRSHARQQWYPSLGVHLPILIGPYIKGPEGKPLKPRTTPLFVVDR